MIEGDKHAAEIARLQRNIDQSQARIAALQKQDLGEIPLFDAQIAAFQEKHPRIVDHDKVRENRMSLLSGIEETTVPYEGYLGRTAERLLVAKPEALQSTWTSDYDHNAVVKRIIDSVSDQAYPFEFYYQEEGPRRKKRLVPKAYHQSLKSSAAYEETEIDPERAKSYDLQVKPHMKIRLDSDLHLQEILVAIDLSKDEEARKFLERGDQPSLHSLLANESYHMMTSFGPYTPDMGGHAPLGEFMVFNLWDREGKDLPSLSFYHKDVHRGAVIPINTSTYTFSPEEDAFVFDNEKSSNHFVTEKKKAAAVKRKKFIFTSEEYQTLLQETLSLTFAKPVTGDNMPSAK